MKYYMKIIAIIVLFVSCSKNVDSLDDFDKIMCSIQQTAWNNHSSPELDKLVQGYVSTIKEDGSWSDIPYSSKVRTKWTPAKHLFRLKELASAYTNPKSGYFQDELLYKHIINAFQFWYDKDPRSTNWYQQQIRCPKLIGETLIIMRAGAQQVPQKLESDLITRMEKLGGRPDQPGSLGSGANKINIATHWIYRGCLIKDDSILSFGMEQVLIPVSFTLDEGLQHDYSFLQHGPQLYMGGYGNVILDNISSIAVHTNGTVYAPSSEKIKLISNYALKAYLPIIRGRNSHFNLIGRAIANPNGLDKSNFIKVIERLKVIDSSNALKYEEAIKRMKGEKPANFGIREMHQHFWRADYSLYTNENYSFDVRMVSSRTKRNENGNGQNLRGYFLSDGATNITVNGDEYENIFPVWDWSMIPGTTTPHVPMASIPVPTQWGTLGSSSFVGGVTDGKNGVSVFDYNDKLMETGARKSWFFLGDKVLCLGSGIESNNKLNINTTVNQCLLKGEVVASTVSGQKVLSSGKYEFSNNLNWAYHNNVGYVFPKGGHITLKNQRQSGSWHSINTNESKEVLSKEVFNLSIEHGVRPINDTYAYFVIPGISSVNELLTYNINNIEIVSCTNDMHVVKDNCTNKWYFVFFKASSYSNEEFSVSVDNPCVFMVDSVDAEEVRVVMSSPGKLNKIIVQGSFPNIKGEKLLVCNLPSEEAYLGSSHNFVFNNRTKGIIPEFSN